MEIKTDDKKDQANDLRSLFEEIEANQVDLSIKENEQHEDNREEEKIEKREFDILNLPPRKEVHLNYKRARLKFSTPFIQFLLVIVIIIAITLTGAYFYWGEEIINLIY